MKLPYLQIWTMEKIRANNKINELHWLISRKMLRA